MTLATAVTLLRLAVLPLLALLILAPQHPALSLAIFAAAAATDWADGLIARRWNQVTTLGARLDPIVDKLFVYTLVVLLWRAEIFAWPVVLLALIRDVSVQFIRNGASADLPVPANRWGKLKFLFQCFAIASAYIALDPALRTPFRVAANALLLAAVAISLPGFMQIIRQHLSVRAQNVATK